MLTLSPWPSVTPNSFPLSGGTSQGDGRCDRAVGHGHVLGSSGTAVGGRGCRCGHPDRQRRKGGTEAGCWKQALARASGESRHELRLSALGSGSLRRQPTGEKSHGWGAESLNRGHIGRNTTEPCSGESERGRGLGGPDLFVCAPAWVGLRYGSRCACSAATSPSARDAVGLRPLRFHDLAARRRHGPASGVGAGRPRPNRRRRSKDRPRAVLDLQA